MTIDITKFESDLQALSKTGKKFLDVVYGNANDDAVGVASGDTAASNGLLYQKFGGLYYRVTVDRESGKTIVNKVQNLEDAACNLSLAEIMDYNCGKMMVRKMSAGREQFVTNSEGLEVENKAVTEDIVIYRATAQAVNAIQDGSIDDRGGMVKEIYGLLNAVYSLATINYNDFENSIFNFRSSMQAGGTTTPWLDAVRQVLTNWNYQLVNLEEQLVKLNQDQDWAQLESEAKKVREVADAAFGPYRGLVNVATNDDDPIKKSARDELEKKFADHFSGIKYVKYLAKNCADTDSAGKKTYISSIFAELSTQPDLRQKIGTELAKGIGQRSPEYNALYQIFSSEQDFTEQYLKYVASLKGSDVIVVLEKDSALRETIIGKLAKGDEQRDAKYKGICKAIESYYNEIVNPLCGEMSKVFEEHKTRGGYDFSLALGVYDHGSAQNKEEVTDWVSSGAFVNKKDSLPNDELFSKAVEYLKNLNGLGFAKYLANIYSSLKNCGKEYLIKVKASQNWKSNPVAIYDKIFSTMGLPLPPEKFAGKFIDHLATAFFGDGLSEECLRDYDKLIYVFPIPVDPETGLSVEKYWNNNSEAGKKLLGEFRGKILQDLHKEERGKEWFYAIADVYRTLDKLEHTPMLNDFTNPLKNVVSMESDVGKFVLTMAGSRDASTELKQAALTAADAYLKTSAYKNSSAEAKLEFIEEAKKRGTLSSIREPRDLCGIYSKVTHTPLAKNSAPKQMGFWSYIKKLLRIFPQPRPVDFVKLANAGLIDSKVMEQLLKKRGLEQKQWVNKLSFDDLHSVISSAWDADKGCYKQGVGIIIENASKKDPRIKAIYDNLYGIYSATHVNINTIENFDAKTQSPERKKEIVEAILDPVKFERIRGLSDNKRNINDPLILKFFDHNGGFSMISDYLKAECSGSLGPQKIMEIAAVSDYFAKHAQHIVAFLREKGFITDSDESSKGDTYKQLLSRLLPRDLVTVNEDTNKATKVVGDCLYSSETKRDQEDEVKLQQSQSMPIRQTI